jgi:aldehyde dehydrogenase
MAVWKMAPALAAGNCIVLKPAEQTPVDSGADGTDQDLLPPGVLNVVNGFGVEAGKPLATNKRIAKIAFTGETTTGRLDHAVRLAKPDPGHAGTGRQIAQHLLRRCLAQDDDFFDKSLEGFTMFALNQGEVCTCPSRALVQESGYDKFIERASSG